MAELEPLTQLYVRPQEAEAERDRLAQELEGMEQEPPAGAPP